MRFLATFLLALPLLISVAFGQQDPQFTMYMFNRQAMNPAYTGAMEATNLTMLMRQQWVGIDGAPRTMTFSGSGYVGSINSGIGGYIIAEELGPLQTIGLNASYAYHLNIGDNSVLNIGVNGGFFQKGLLADDPDFWRYNRDAGIDPVVAQGNFNAFVPDLGAGLYFRTKMTNNSSLTYPRDKFYIGASVSHILEPSIEKLIPTNGQAIGEDSRLRRGIMGTAGATFEFGSNIFLQPSILVMTDLASAQYSLNTNLYISPMVFGLSYRGGLGVLHGSDSFDGIIGFNANTNLFVGYAYDFTVSELSQFTSGSHEILISYTFPNVMKQGPTTVDPSGRGGTGRR